MCDNIYTKVEKTIKEGRNIFITGGAGTGKSTLLGEIKQKLLPDMYLTATTGIAAINIEGQTIHSWAGVGNLEESEDSITYLINRNKPLLQQIQTATSLAIDEISMLSASALDKISKVLKKVRNDNRAMGGIQTILIGDFFQLPPVTAGKHLNFSDFCFNSLTWKELNLETILLKEVHRQQNEADEDNNFIDLLNKMRVGDKLSLSDLRMLENREIEPENSEDILNLFARNKDADNYNRECLDNINSTEFTFTADDFCRRNNVSEAYQIYSKKFTDDEIKQLNQKTRIPKKLKLKIGCKVMLLKNDKDQNLANGSCGKVVGIDQNNQIINVLFDGTSKPIDIHRVETEISTTTKEEKLQITENSEKVEVISTKQSVIRNQFPLTLAYGISIHKSQGMTVDQLVVDLNGVFADGQAYVALSRVKSLHGLYLKNFDPRIIFSNPFVTEFYRNLENPEYQNSLQSQNIQSLIQVQKSIEDLQKNALVSNDELQTKIQNSINKIQELLQQTMTDIEPFIQQNTDEIQDIIQKAIDSSKNLKIQYQDRNGNISERIVQPNKMDIGKNLGLNGNTVYLNAHCTLRNEERNFKLQNIAHATIIK